jgi:signal transduction histidine kinase
LLENAVEHGGPAIAIEVRVEEGPPLSIVVEDNGQGQTARSAEGRGLGLAIARRLIAAHGGTLQWESKPGEGTRARLELPLTESLQSPGNS